MSIKRNFLHAFMILVLISSVVSCSKETNLKGKNVYEQVMNIETKSGRRLAFEMLSNAEKVEFYKQHILGKMSSYNVEQKMS